MNRVVLLFVGLILSLNLAAQPSLPTVSELSEGWNEIPTGGMCTSGTPFQFYVNDSPGSDDLLIYFNGGGACWTGEACDLNSQPNLHSPYADMSSNSPANFHGMFADEVTENPFAEFDKVVVPYCTGDVHLGAGERTYTYINSEDREVTVSIYHNGFINSTTVLDWVNRNYDSPSRIVVAGSSAGAIGSSFYAGLIAKENENTPVTLIADAAGGYNSPDLQDLFHAWNIEEILPDWPEYAGKTNDNLTFEDFYIASANHNSNLTIAQYNTAEDSVQKTFSYLLGDTLGGFSLPQRIFNHYVEIESAVEKFYSYTAGGSVHVILPTEDFYDYKVKGESLVDWVRKLVNEVPVRDISCVNELTGCDDPPDTD